MSAEANTHWRETQAAALVEQAAAVADALIELDNVHALLETRHRTELCGELRALASALRAEAKAMESEAQALRVDRPSGPMPMALTTRYPRRRSHVDHPVHEPAAGLEA